MNDPSLGVELRAVGLVVDAHVSADLREFLERLRFGRAHVRRRDDAHAPPAFHDLRELIDQRADAGPANEAHQEVHVRRAGQFAADLLADGRLRVAVDEQLVR